MNTTFPTIVGILNVTPDSFSDGGLYSERDAAVAHAELLISQGAEMLDVGGESTRLGAEQLSVEQELARVIPVIAEVAKRFPAIPMSIDTRKAEVARAAIDAGARIINDVSAGLFDEKMLGLAAQLNVPIVLMHMQGQPQSMQQNPHYENVSQEVFDFLHDRIVAAHAAGVKDVIVDVGIGIGFGKSLEHNLQLLRDHPAFLHLGVPLMLGISRKRFIGALSGIEKAEDRDVATALMHALLIHSGANYLRVHRVDTIVLLRRLYNGLVTS